MCFSDLYGSGQSWIGIRNFGYGWIFIDHPPNGTPVSGYSSWNSGQPFNDPQHTCVIENGGLWSTSTCDKAYGIVCQRLPLI